MSTDGTLLPLSPRLRVALIMAERRAQRRGAATIDVLDVFIALADQSGSPVRTLVQRVGYDIDALWRQFREELLVHPFPVAARCAEVGTFAGGEGI
jgi:ATP-dependent Clp protease ATP-binding subunit ClpA